MYAKKWLLGIEDLTEFVAEQRAKALAPFDRLLTPSENVYPVANPEVAARLGLSPIEAGGVHGDGKQGTKVPTGLS